ncbi:MAG: TIGR01777 family protein [Planctomycetes bacterium]|nr:TIGR01777 family protein [Planctomycetota bacterium]
MRIAITGASGFVGSALAATLAGEHEVLRLVRHLPGSGQARWEPATGAIELAGLAPPTAVVHLAAENIAAGRWTRARREQLRTSRVTATERLTATMAGWHPRPSVLIAASGVGIHGDRGDELLTEDSSVGQGFLAELARDWEQATRPAADAGIRVVNLRLGVVLGPGGALHKMLLPFRLGLGGRLGHGRQWFSWIALADALAAIRQCLVDQRLRGPVAAVAPHPVTNREFTRALARALHRPALLPVPAFVLRLLIGRMADEALLASQRVLPRRLLDTGFRFAHERIDSGLAAALAAR